MTRLMFGGGVSDVYLVPDAEGDLHTAGGAVVKFYNAEVGGTQYTDLLDVNNQPATSITTSTGADGRVAGRIPPFYGPDGVFEMWASANDSARFLMQPANLGSFLGPMRSQLDAHVAAENPHGTDLADLGDVDPSVATAAAGKVLTRGPSGLWIASDPAGGSGGGTTGAVMLTGDQSVAGTKTFNSGDVNKSTVILQAALTGQVADVFAAFSGTDTGQGAARQRTTYLNEKGELRVISAKTNSVAVRIKGQPGQTANIAEITDTSNVAKAWFAANYAFYAPNAGRSLLFTVKGAVTTGIGTFVYYNDLGVPLTIRSVRASLGTAFTTGTTTIDVNVQGSTVFITQANRPVIAAGQKTSGKVTTIDSAALPDGQYLTVDVDTVGTAGAGADLVVQIELW